MLSVIAIESLGSDAEFAAELYTLIDRPPPVPAATADTETSIPGRFGHGAANGPETCAVVIVMTPTVIRPAVASRKTAVGSRFFTSSSPNRGAKVAKEITPTSSARHANPRPNFPNFQMDHAEPED